MGILMGLKQWTTWVTKQLEGNRAVKSLNQKGYVQHFKQVAPSVVANDNHMIPLSRGSVGGQELHHSTITTGSLLGPRSETTIVPLNTHQVIIPTMSTNTNSTVSSTHTVDTNTITNTQKSQKRRSKDTYRHRDNMLQRKRRILQRDRFKNMPPELTEKIASITDRTIREKPLHTWLKSQVTQTILRSYPKFQQYVDRLQSLQRLSDTS